MLTKETGFDSLAKEVFDIDNVEKLSSSAFFNVQKYSTSVLPEAYNKIYEYFNKNKPKLSAKMLLGIFATFACGDVSTELKDLLIKKINSIETSFYNELENLIPRDIDSNFNKSNMSYYLDIANMDLSKKSFDLLNYSHFPDLIKEYNVYGICYLLEYLADYNFRNFDNWFYSTKRTDLRILFLYQSCRNNHLLNFKNSHYEKSKNICFKVAHIISSYPLSRYISFSADKKIEELHKTILSEDEKFYGFIYYLFENYGKSDINKLDEDARLKEILNFLSKNKHFELLNENIVEEFYLNWLNFEIARRIITLVPNKKHKEELLIYLQGIILKRFKDNKTHTYHSLLTGNILGRVLKELPEKYFNKLLKDFNKVYKKTNLPYFYNRNQEEWNQSTDLLFLYLIAIYVYEYPQGEILKQYLNKYKEVKKDLFHALTEYFDSIIEQFNSL